MIPLFCIKTFVTRKFLNHRIVPVRSFPALWDKKISTVNIDNPLLSFKISDTRILLEDRDSPFWNFWYCEKNNFRQKRDTSSYASFLIQKFSEKIAGPLRNFFRYCETKKISRANRDIPLVSRNIFDKGIFLRNEGFPYETFRYCEKINFRQNHDTPSYAIFLIQKFSETKWYS